MSEKVYVPIISNTNVVWKTLYALTSIFTFFPNKAILQAPNFLNFDNTYTMEHVCNLLYELKTHKIGSYLTQKAKTITWLPEIEIDRYIVCPTPKPSNEVSRKNHNVSHP